MAVLGYEGRNAVSGSESSYLFCWYARIVVKIAFLGFMDGFGNRRRKTLQKKQMLEAWYISLLQRHCTLPDTAYVVYVAE